MVAKHMDYFKKITKLSLVVLIVCFCVGYIDFDAFIKGITVDLMIAMFVSQFMVMIAVFFMSIRLSIYSGGLNSNYYCCYKAIFLSMGFNIIVPGRLSEFVKPFYLKSKAGIKFENGLCSVFLERISDLLTLSSLAVFVLSSTFFEISSKIFIIVPFFIFLLLFSLPRLSSFLEKIIEKIRINTIGNLLNNILFHLTDSVKDQRLVRGFSFGLLGWLFSMLSLVSFFMIADGGSISVSQCLVIFVVSTFAYAVPALPAGVGTYEASIVFVLNRFGYDLEKSVLLAISLHVAQIFLIGIATTIILVREDLNIFNIVKRSKLKHV